MASTLYQQQLKGLCLSQETFERAKSILNLVSLRTGHGTGFAGNTATLPAVAAYLASEQLGTNEVTLNTAAVSACVQRRVFEDFLKKVRKAIQFDGDDQEQLDASGVVTYQSLVASHVPQDALDAVEWMEEAEEALPGAVMLKDRHGTTSVKCAVFSWVCDLIQVRFPHSVANNEICAAYNVPLRTLKSIANTLDLHCGDIADRIRSGLPHQSTGSSATPSKSYPNTRLQVQASLKKSPTKSAMKGKSREQELTPSKTPSQKRAVVFSRSIRSSDDMDDDVSFPATPTKKRRVDSSANVTSQAGIATTPRKRTTRATDEDTAIAAFHAAVTGRASNVSSPARPVPPLPRLLGTRTTPGDADPSTPRPSASARPRRRYYPVFLDQQQWLARDQRVERIWADAVTHCSQMVELYGHPLERYRPVLA
ncbi:hypothetical protein SCLCIDRAFT_125474 [Scleroderma citrinum Foug A]|uniref:Uncharacterized protein n=1 Tax=Scleroderma citrinum Foug A TaxID=1036808 RepID=A0A0C3DV47_9AGAM|nr:hypothetical protein SCLCIDRAFT_125474 [Scleroderma citrinum Foug A]